MRHRRGLFWLVFREPGLWRSPLKLNPGTAKSDIRMLWKSVKKKSGAAKTMEQAVGQYRGRREYRGQYREGEPDWESAPWRELRRPNQPTSVSQRGGTAGEGP